MMRAAAAAFSWLLVAACATRLQPTLSSPRADAGVRARFVGYAQAMLGRPYQWGGSTPGGFDCSGLVAYAASGAGFYVPRTAKEQLAFGTRIARDALQPGDLVFMHFHRKELHVVIVIDAEHFIHSPASGGMVRIDRLQAEPYRSAIIDARRIIPFPGNIEDST